jgi:NADPH:quinone reductase-like Zn-dependent oxidoreductase
LVGARLYIYTCTSIRRRVFLDILRRKNIQSYTYIMATHLAAISLAKGQPFELQTRPTPKPGPGELLIEVKSVALNPADGYIRDQGLFISTYPTVIGFDISGLVLEVGDNVPGSLFQPGITRVAAYAAPFWRSWGPDYGAFQERCLVPWQHAAPLPDEGISWNQAATLPVSVEVPLNAWDIMGISSSSSSADTNRRTQENKKQKRDALLIWGASSSVGTMGVQAARLLREDHDSCFAAVYATAGAANQEYVSSLGADRVFDHRDSHVVNAIVSAAREDGVVIRHCFLATGQLAPCQAVLKAFLEHDSQGIENQKAKIASAPPIPPDAEEVNGVETIFVLPSANEEERLARFQYWMGTWMVENLAKGNIRPSPEPRVVGKGLEAINAGLDVLLRGVSCTKLVVEVAE